MNRTNKVLRTAGYTEVKLEVYSCGRLKTCHGIYKWETSTLNFGVSNHRLGLASRSYKKYGPYQILVTLDHELAHHIDVMENGHSSHGPKFQRILKAIKEIK